MGVSTASFDADASHQAHVKKNAAVFGQTNCATLCGQRYNVMLAVPSVARPRGTPGLLLSCRDKKAAPLHQRVLSIVGQLTREQWAEGMELGKMPVGPRTAVAPC